MPPERIVRKPTLFPVVTAAFVFLVFPAQIQQSGEGYLRAEEWGGSCGTPCPGGGTCGRAWGLSPDRRRLSRKTLYQTSAWNPFNYLRPGRKLQKH